VSVGFRKSDQPPPLPPLEILLWRVTKDRRVAEARLRVLAHAREFRVTVGDILVVSRLFRGDEDVWELGDESAGALDRFLGHGWTHAPESITPDHVV
jgi:hypothetical protein